MIEIIRAYIFDQDGTLYPKKSTLTDALRERTKQWISERLNLSRQKVEELYAQLPERFPHPYHGFLSLGLSPEEYHQEVFDKINPAFYLDKDKKLTALFEKISKPKFVVTFASVNYSHRLQDRIGIHGLVERIVFAIDYPPTYSKSEAYNSIRDELGLNASEICVVGDNLYTDVLPAKENGFRTVLVGRTRDFRDGFDCVDTIYDLECLLKENRTPR